MGGCARDGARTAVRGVCSVSATGTAVDRQNEKLLQSGGSTSSSAKTSAPSATGTSHDDLRESAAVPDGCMMRSGVVAADESVLGLSAGVSVSDSGLNGGSSRRCASASQSTLAKKA